jgi:uncharacterized protein YecT (DUF1311 family)
MRKRWLSIGLAALLGLAAVIAATQAMAGTQRSTYTQCLKHAQNTFDMDQCVGTELKRLKPILAAAEAKLANDKNDSAAHRREFTRAESAWKTFVNRDCAFYGDFAKGGTLQPILEGECKVDRQTARIKQLKVFARGLGG